MNRTLPGGSSLSLLKILIFFLNLKSPGFFPMFFQVKKKKKPYRLVNNLYTIYNEYMHNLTHVFWERPGGSVG